MKDSFQSAAEDAAEVLRGGHFSRGAQLERLRTCALTCGVDLEEDDISAAPGSGYVLVVEKPV